MAQLVVRLDDDLATEVDDLVAAGGAASRSDAVRKGLERLLEEHRRSEIGRRIVEGYRQRPQTDEEAGWSDQATVDMIADEPW